ncbi:MULTISPECIES: KTSC domain-containing protein [unclassified Eikenella]|uniref:KTSC domain-containing protein n=1 Tax=unclassified Eikenella TaxID=2639367 RepID=UPI0009EE348E
MHHQFVSSSTLLSIGYEHPVLEVRFKHGGCYQYHGVPASIGSPSVAVRRSS